MRKKLRLGLLTAATPVIALTSVAPVSAEAAQRQLLVFAPPDSAALTVQRQLLATSADMLRDRDLVVIDFDTVHRPANLLQSRYKVARNAFTVLLIGKDGGIKLRSVEPVRPERLFAIIDAMPMRQEEMHRRSDRRR